MKIDVSFYICVRLGNPLTDHRKIVDVYVNFNGEGLYAICVCITITVDLQDPNNQLNELTCFQKHDFK